MNATPDDDVKVAIRHAQGLGDEATREHTAALTALLVEQLGASAQRLRSTRDKLLQPATVGLWDQDAIKLLDCGLTMLAEAGVTTAEAEQACAARLHAENYPEPQPFSWNRSRRHSLVWWLRRAWLTRLWIYEETSQTAVMQRASFYIGRTPIGHMKYFICDQCNLALIGNIEIAPEYQGYGLGQRVIMSLFRRHRTYRWHTTAQYDTSGTFWPKIAQRTGARFTFADQCVHMK